MPLLEKFGGLWVKDSTDVRSQPIYDRFEPTTGLLAIVVRSPSGHFIASIFEKSPPDPQWCLPFWSERRPEALFAEEAAAISHVEALLQAAREA
jgi:hypothetical protein